MHYKFRTILSIGLFTWLTLAIVNHAARAADHYNTLDIPSSATPSGAAGGSLSGTYPNPGINGPATITGGSIDATPIGATTKAPGSFADIGASNVGLLLRSYPGAPTSFAALYSSDLTPSGTNYSFIAGAGSIFYNGTVAMHFRISNVEMFSLQTTGVIQYSVSFTVSTLPTCNSGEKGGKTVVSDALVPTFLGTLTGGSSTYTPVICNGTAWVAY